MESGWVFGAMRRVIGNWRGYHGIQLINLIEKLDILGLAQWSADLTYRWDAIAFDDVISVYGRIRDSFSLAMSINWHRSKFP
jgi:hypothetical protein